MFGLFKYTEKKCAQEVITALKKHDFGSIPVYEPERGRVVFGEDKIINLGNIFNRANRLTKADRKEFIEGFVKTSTEEADITYDNSAHLLVPRLKSKAEIELRELHFREGGGNKYEQLSYDFTNNYILELGIDSEQAIRVVNESTLESLGLSKKDAFATAIKNLNSISESPFEELAEGLYASKFSDDHDAARALLEHDVRKLEVKGRHLAIPASGATLLITGTEDFAIHEKLIEVIQSATEAQRPLCNLPLVLNETGWEDFDVPSDEKYSDLQNLITYEMINQYDGQKESLEHLCEKEAKDVFVASYTVYEQKESPRLKSIAVWSEGVHSYLPVADVITFVQFINDEAEPVGEVDYTTAIETFGGLMKPLGMNPERYEVIEFPTQKQISGAVADSDF